MHRPIGSPKFMGFSFEGLLGGGATAEAFKGIALLSYIQIILSSPIIEAAQQTCWS